MDKKNNLLNIGWLILRVGIGISIFFHGLPKIMGGPDTWAMVGSTMSNFGIDSGHTFWGFLAASSEMVGGLLFALGFLFRPAAIMLAGTMAVALITHLSMGDSFSSFGHAMELLIVFTGSILIGAGKYSVDAKLLPKIA
ncbi:MAG: DoxX family protein [Fermentimonas sp.]|nr:DoxX family protein [Fermentimonas sp.]MDD4009798.1 DoxX family protein [Fermentimonas sp.]MDD4696587.1 DoxX family protein [Fermentimonas sp.]